MTEKVFSEFTSETKDNSKVHYLSPERKGGKRKSRAVYVDEGEKCTLYYDTNRILLKNGVQRKNEIVFVEFDIDDDNRDLCRFIGELDELGIATGVRCCSEWFGRSLDFDSVDEIYKPVIKTNARGIQSIKIRIDEDNFQIKTDNGKKTDLSALGQNSVVKLRIRYDGLVFCTDAFYPEFNVVCIKYYEPKRVFNGGYGFQGDSLALETDYETDVSEFDRKNEEKIRELMKRHVVVDKSLDDSKIQHMKTDEMDEVEEVEVGEEVEIEASGEKDTVLDDSSGKDLDTFIRETEGQRDEPREVGEIVNKTLTKIGGDLSLVDEEPLVFTNTLTKEEFFEMNMELIKRYMNSWEKSNNSINSETGDSFSSRMEQKKLAIFKGDHQVNQAAE